MLFVGSNRYQPAKNHCYLGEIFVSLREEKRPTNMMRSGVCRRNLRQSVWFARAVCRHEQRRRNSKVGIRFKRIFIDMQCNRAYVNFCHRLKGSSVLGPRTSCALERALCTPSKLRISTPKTCTGIITEVDICTKLCRLCILQNRVTRSRRHQRRG